VRENFNYFEAGPRVGLKNIHSKATPPRFGWVDIFKGQPRLLEEKWL
jgi:hypothetical protein